MLVFEELQVPRIASLGDEIFPAILPLSELPHRVSLDDLIYDHDLTREHESLAAPDTAVVAELQQCLGPHPHAFSNGMDLVCSLRGNRYLVIRNELLGLPDDKERVEKLFPRARIAIKSGIVRCDGGGAPVIYVACGAAIEFMGLAEEDERPSSVPENDRAEYLITQGDKEYSKQEFVLAGLFFSAAAEAASSSDEQQARAYSWHAKCMVNLNRFEDAIKSFDKTLSRDPCHGNALIARGKCFSMLQRHRKGLVDMEALLSYPSPSKEISETLPMRIARISQLAQQEATGEYDLRQFVLSGFDPSKAPVCSNFISDAIRIRMTGDERGRGVFVSREVKTGELLMVSNPLLVAGTHEQLLITAVWEYGRSSRFRRLLSLLGDPDEPQEKLPLPEIRDFSEFKDDGSTGVIDVGKIKRIVRASLFPVQDFRGRLVIAEAPSFVNHSCVPNTSMFIVGCAFFLRAAKTIRAGEEITIAYTDCLRPLAKRSEDLLEFGFRCRCRRCEVEKRYQAELRGVPAELKPEPDVVKDAVSMMKKLEIVLGKLPAITEEERDLIRVGYVQGYMHVSHGRGNRDICREVYRKFKAFKSDAEAMEIIQALVPGEFTGLHLVAMVVLRHMVELEWEPRLERILDVAVAGLMGDVSLPAEDYLTICETLDVNMDKLLSLTGRFNRGRFALPL